MNRKLLLCAAGIGLAAMLLAGCIPDEEAVKATQPADTEVSIIQEAASITAAPTMDPTAMPTDESAPMPTPSPTSIPQPTREPMPGDITNHFPTWDTGADANYSYQSDELRIAIDVVEDEEELQKYYVADIWVRNIHSFRTGFGNGKFGGGTEDGEDFAVREHAILAVNGSMNYGIIYHNGEKFRGFSSSVANPGVAVLFTDGSMKVYHKNSFSPAQAVEKGIFHAWQFGPILVTDGKMARNFPERAARHPRIILGYYEPGHYVLVAVDGRSKTALGMTEREMAELMLRLGCQEAMNLDGGTSAIMVFMGECISHPSGKDKDGDGKAGRNLKDMLLFAEYDSEGNAPKLEDVDRKKVTIR